MRALLGCRWCGADVPAGRGRPKTWCSDECRRAYRDTFGAVRWDGPVRFVTVCGGGCTDPVIESAVRGPVVAPGRWAVAHAALVEALHGHPVTVTVEPAPYPDNDQVYDNYQRLEDAG